MAKAWIKVFKKQVKATLEFILQYITMLPEKSDQKSLVYWKRYTCREICFCKGWLNFAYIVV